MKKDYILDILRSKKTVFTFKDIVILWGECDTNFVKKKIYRYIKSGKLNSLRKGIYSKDENYNSKELAVSIYFPSYISFETVLREKGVIFQHYNTIFIASKWSKSLEIDNNKLSFRKIKDEALFNSIGVLYMNNYNIATVERAFLDMIYLFPDYYFDNLRSIDWGKCEEIVKIYNNKQLVKRLKEYRKKYDQ